MIEGNSENFEKEVLKSDIPVLVDFNASWCGPCQATAAILEPLAEAHKDFKIVSVDIDEEDELAEKYDVMTIPCLVVFKDGKEVNRDAGMISEKRILKMMGLK
ncbi:thioredoxin [Candidatus Saccharibacteria bacterium]|nr:thioredoxin [Candidatus Saccharibacteria bacterium]